MKLWRYRDNQLAVKRERVQPNKNPSRTRFSAYALLTLVGLSSCAVDPTLKEQLEGTWVLAENGFGCFTDTTEFAEVDTLVGVYDDIILEVAGNDARITRASGSCEEVFEFFADFSREGELFLLPSKAVVCTGCTEEGDYCGQTPSGTWAYSVTLSEEDKSLSLVSVAETDGFATSCGTIEYSEGTTYAPTAQVDLTKQ